MRPDRLIPTTTVMLLDRRFAKMPVIEEAANTTPVVSNELVESLLLSPQTTENNVGDG